PVPRISPAQNVERPRGGLGRARVRASGRDHELGAVRPGNGVPEAVHPGQLHRTAHRRLRAPYGQASSRALRGSGKGLTRRSKLSDCRTKRYFTLLAPPFFTTKVMASSLLKPQWPGRYRGRSL